MYFNFYSYIQWFISQSLLLALLFLFINFENLTLNWHDVYSRVLVNDFYWNLYYFLWTSFWYIPWFILGLVLFQKSLYIKWQHIIFSSLITIVFLITTYDIHMYWLLNTSTYDITLKSNHFNNLLLNSINKYHPGLLYWSSLLIVTYWFSFNFFYQRFHFILFQHEFIFHRKFLWTSFLMCFTLLLGGWWALQEGSWGGWWNWDPSEVFGLIILIFYIVYNHKILHKQKVTWSHYTNIIYVLLLMQLYFFTQLNFDLVSHNFGTKIDNFIDNSNLYVLVITSGAVFIIYFCKLFIQISVRTTLYCSMQVNKTLNYSYVWLFYLLCLISIEINYSLVPLFNDFLWKLWNLNISNLVIMFEKYNLQLFYTVVLYFWSPHTLSIFFLIYLTWFNLLQALFYTIISTRTVLIFHTYINYFIWLSLLSTSFLWVDWDLSTYSSLLSNSIYNFELRYSILTLSSITLECLQPYFMQNGITYSWNIYTVDTTPDVYHFYYHLTTNMSSQVMFIGSKLFSFFITVNDILSTSFIGVLMGLFTLYWWYFKIHLRIIF
jgi:hypothetical protein